MTPFPRPLFIFICSAFLLVTLSCTIKSGPKNEEEFYREISRLNKITQTSQDRIAQADAHLQLARIYLYHENPFLDYQKALEELESYQALAPEDSNAEDTQNWLSVLYRVERLEEEHQQMERRMENLNEESALRKEKLDHQTEVVRELKTKVERLGLENGQRKEALEQQRKKSQKLQEDIESLQVNNEILKEMIERLKTLDREIEEKRKTLKY